jgi:hypothetical protein
MSEAAHTTWRYEGRYASRRAAVELVLGLANGLLAAVTVIWHDWMELLLGVDPDRGNGTIEWSLVAVLCLFAAGLLKRARHDWTAARLSACELPTPSESC